MRRSARDAIAATKTANRCHAGAVRPAGTGMNQMPIAIAKGTARFRSNPGAIIWASLPLPVGRRERDPSGRWRAPGSSRPPPRSRIARRTRRNPSRRHTGPCRPGTVPVMWLRAAVPSPLSSLNTWSPCSSVQTLRPTKPRVAVDERDDLRAESDAGALRAREQHRSAQVDDRATPLRAEGNGLATAGGVPRALEFPPFAGRSGRFRRLRGRPACGHRNGQNKKDVTSRHAATRLSIVPPCPCEKDHGR